MSDKIPGDPYGPDNPAFESPQERAKSAVHAIMYEFTYDMQTLAITHAGVVGGYPSVDECRQNMSKVGVYATAQLDKGEQLQLQCSGIKEPMPSEDEPAAPATDDPPKPKTPI
jgi:hypothetical protein